MTVIYKSENDFDIPHDLKGFIAFFQDKLDAIPEGKRDRGYVDLVTNESFGMPRIEVEVGYQDD